MTEKQAVQMMKALGCSYEEAVQIIKDDEAIDRGEKLFEQTAEQKKATKQMTAAGGSKHKEKAKRERKVDADKQTIIGVIHDGLERDLVDWGLMTNLITKNESELILTYNENEYTVKLIKHRKSKEEK